MHPAEERRGKWEKGKFMYCILAQERNVAEMKVLLASLRQSFVFFRALCSWKRKEGDGVAIEFDTDPKDREPQVSKGSRIE
jgi:hypothetical protein